MVKITIPDSIVQIHVQSVVVSHSYLNNRNTKYLNNDESSADNLSLKLRSVEQETKFRIENTSTFGNWKINFGIIFPNKHTNRFSMIPGFVKNPGL